MDAHACLEFLESAWRQLRQAAARVREDDRFHSLLRRAERDLERCRGELGVPELRHQRRVRRVTAALEATTYAYDSLESSSSAQRSDRLLTKAQRLIERLRQDLHPWAYKDVV